MRKGNYVQIFRRRRTGKTDYRKRKGLVLGRNPLFAVRVSNRYVYGQIVEAKQHGDITLCSISSKDLRDSFGWKGSCKNLPAAYLAGFALGRKALSKKIAGAFVYSGVGGFVHGSRVAAAVAGAMDAGMRLEADKESLPEGERLNGTHIAEFAKKMQNSNGEGYDRIFSRSKVSGFNLLEFPRHFDEVKQAISKSDPK